MKTITKVIWGVVLSVVMILVSTYIPLNENSSTPALGQNFVMILFTIGWVGIFNYIEKYNWKQITIK